MSRPAPQITAHRGPWIAFWALCAGALVAMIAAHVAGGDAPAAVFTVWGLMVIAVMAPTAAPMLRAFTDLETARNEATRSRFFVFLGGYVAVWLVVSVAFAMAQLALAAAGLAGADGASPAVVALLLAIAGAYQFSPLKHACASRCRSPIAFLMAHWKTGAAGAFRLGARHGVDCVGCCWALMLVALAGGAVSLWWMSGVMVLAAVEKLPGLGARITAPVGAVLLGAAIVTLAITIL
jgi:predicted metal-binding membrane protein